jgi:hypothetical protein
MVRPQRWLVAARPAITHLLSWQGGSVRRDGGGFRPDPNASRAAASLRKPRAEISRLDKEVIPTEAPRVSHQQPPCRWHRCAYLGR